MATSKSGNWGEISPPECYNYFHSLHHRALQSSVFLGRHAACICTRNSCS